MIMYQSMQRRWLRQMDGPTQINQWTREIKMRDSQVRGLGVALVVICIISFPPRTPGYFWQGSSALALISPCVLSIHDGIAFGNICLAGSPTPRESPRWAVIILTSHLDGPSSILGEMPSQTKRHLAKYFSHFNDKYYPSQVWEEELREFLDVSA